MCKHISRFVNNFSSNSKSFIQFNLLSKKSVSTLLYKFQSVFININRRIWIPFYKFVLIMRSRSLGQYWFEPFVTSPPTLFFSPERFNSIQKGRWEEKQQFVEVEVRIKCWVETTPNIFIYFTPSSPSPSLQKVRKLHEKIFFLFLFIFYKNLENDKIVSLVFNSLFFFFCFVLIW